MLKRTCGILCSHSSIFEVLSLSFKFLSSHFRTIFSQNVCIIFLQNVCIFYLAKFCENFRIFCERIKCENEAKVTKKILLKILNFHKTIFPFRWKPYFDCIQLYSCRQGEKEDLFTNEAGDQVSPPPPSPALTSPLVYLIFLETNLSGDESVILQLLFTFFIFLATQKIPVNVMKNSLLNLVVLSSYIMAIPPSENKHLNKH